jgi:broad specificity phosphatase PhoE
MTWGPDALLTPTGEDQARAIAAAWTAPARAGVPVPTAFYTSPLTRAADTLALTFGRAGVVLERLRKTKGVHTCDKRRPKSWIAARAPGAVFEAGFTEEDELWEPDVRETDEAQQARIRDALVQILDNDASTCRSRAACHTIGMCSRACYRHLDYGARWHY